MLSIVNYYNEQSRYLGTWSIFPPGSQPGIAHRLVNTFSLKTPILWINLSLYRTHQTDLEFSGELKQILQNSAPHRSRRSSPAPTGLMLRMGMDAVCTGPPCRGCYSLSSRLYVGVLELSGHKGEKVVMWVASHSPRIWGLPTSPSWSVCVTFFSRNDVILDPSPSRCHRLHSLNFRWRKLKSVDKSAVLVNGRGQLSWEVTVKVMDSGHKQMVMGDGHGPWL